MPFFLKTRTLPDTLAQLTKLGTLFADTNKFASTPRVLPQLLALSYLVLTNNRITHVGAMPPNVINLFLDDNWITTISAAAMAAMPMTLVQLHLRNNRIRSLPTTLGLLTNLEVLSLQGNELTELPAEIGRLTSLISRQPPWNLLRIHVRFQVCIGAEGYCSNIVHRLL